MTRSTAAAVLALVATSSAAPAGPIVTSAPVSSEWTYTAAFQTTHTVSATPGPLNYVPGHDINLPWASGATGTVVGTNPGTASGGGGSTYGVPDKTFVVGLGGVMVYSLLPQATDPSYRASDTAHLSWDFTLNDGHGHQQTVTVGGTLPTAWTGPDRFTTAFAFDGVNPDEFDRTITVGGIDYSTAFRYGTPPGYGPGSPAYGLAGYGGPNIQSGDGGQVYGLVSSPNQLPEPGTLALTCVGAVVLAGVRRFTRK